MLLEVVRAVDGQPDVALGAGVGPGPAPARPLVRSSARPPSRTRKTPAGRSFNCRISTRRRRGAVPGRALTAAAQDRPLPECAADAGRTKDIRRRRPHRGRPPTPGPPGATGGRGLPPPRGAARRSAGRQGVVITRRPRPGERADDQHPAARPALPDPHQPHRGHPGREGRLPAAAPAHRSGRGCGAGG